MKKAVILFFVLAVSAVVFFSYKAQNDDTIFPLTDDEVREILSNNYIELEKEFAPITKEMENKLYGEWDIMEDGIGYSLKHNITGGHLCDGLLHISKEKYEETLRTYKTPIIDSYLSPVFIYYSETLDEMSADEILNYSGIEGLDSETIGIVIIGFALSDYSPDNYDLIPTKYILIDEYVIAVRTYSFYELKRATRK